MDLNVEYYFELLNFTLESRLYHRNRFMNGILILSKKRGLLNIKLNILFPRLCVGHRVLKPTPSYMLIDPFSTRPINFGRGLDSESLLLIAIIRKSRVKNESLPPYFARFSDNGGRLQTF